MAHTARIIIRRLRPSPERLAAAGALQDPNLLLQLQAARLRDKRRTDTPPRRGNGRRLPRGETGGALLLVAAVAVAATSPVTWGIVLAFMVGKPLGIVIAASGRRRAAVRLSARELRGTALSAGVGFTVALLIASRAFDGALLDQAKVGILASALLAPALAIAALAARRPAGVALTSPCPA